MLMLFSWRELEFNTTNARSLSIRLTVRRTRIKSIIRAEIKSRNPPPLHIKYYLLRLRRAENSSSTPRRPYLLYLINTNGHNTALSRPLPLKQTRKYY